METGTLSREELIEKVKKQEAIISQLQNRVDDYATQLKNEKISHVKLVCDFEIEEEKAANTLLRKLENVNKEKQKILQEMEKEEEYMTNILLKKLQESQSQKIKMENELEKEEEFISNKLQAKIRELSEANSKLELELDEKSPRLEFQLSNMEFRVQKMEENEIMLYAQIKELREQNARLTKTIQSLQQKS